MIFWRQLANTEEKMQLFFRLCIKIVNSTKQRCMNDMKQAEYQVIWDFQTAEFLTSELIHKVIVLNHKSMVNKICFSEQLLMQLPWIAD